MALRVLRQFNFRSVVTVLSVIGLIVSGFVSLPTSSKANFQNSTTPSSTVAPTSDFDYFANFPGEATQQLYVTTPAAVIPATTDFTVEAWIRPTALPASGQKFVIVSQGSGINQASLAVKEVSGSLQLLFENGVATIQTSSLARGLALDAWTHVAVSVSSSGTSLYRDGVKVQTSVSKVAPNTGIKFTISATGGSTATNLFKGGIDQVKVWDKSLDAAGILTSMHSHASEASAGDLLAHYDFNERSNGMVFDRTSQSGHHLTTWGRVTFTDVKTYRELNGKVIYSFPRTYLTSNGGWKLPTGATAINALVVGGGGAGGWADDVVAGGGGAGQVIEKSAQAVVASSVLQVKVGQGGLNYDIPAAPTNGGSSLLKVVSGSTIAESAGGGHGAYGGYRVNNSNPSAGVFGPGASGTDYAGGNGSGGNGAGALGVAPSTANGENGSLPTASEFAAEYFGGGGGTAATYAGGKGGGGAGATNVTATSAVPNTGGGGGGAAQTSSGAGEDFGGNGGSGIIIVSVNQLAKCAYMAGKYNLSPYGGPNIVFGPLTGGGNPGNIVIHRDGSATASTASFHGEPALVNGKLYIPDLGNAKLKILPYDMASPRSLVGSLPSPGLGATADERYVYTWNSTGVSRYDTIDGTFIQTFVPKGDMLKSAGEMAFVRYKGKGYLFLVNGDVNKSGTNYSRIYFVQVSGEGANPAATSLPALSLADNLFSESKLAAGTASSLPSSGIAVVGDNLYWTTYGPTTNPKGEIYRKSLTDFDTGSNGKPVDTNADEILLSNQMGLRSLAADSANLFFNADGGSSSSSVFRLNLATKRVTEANGPGPGGTTANGSTPVASCAIAPTMLQRSKAADGTFGLTIGSPFPNDTQGISYQVEYRSNGGNWVTQTSFAGSKTLSSIALPASVQGYVEFRVATRVSLGNEIQVSEYFLAAPILVGNPPQPPLCSNPTKLVYAVAASDAVQISLTNHLDEAVAIDWGNGTRSSAISWQGNNLFTGRYSAAGTYTVSICGKFAGMGDSEIPQPKLTALTAWGEADATLTDLSNAFLKATNLRDVPATLPAAVTNLESTFSGATSFNDPDVKTWVTTNVTTLKTTFSGATNFNQDLGSWDTSNVTTMFGTFSSASAFNNGGTDGIKNWDTSKVTDMSLMFATAKAFNQPITYVAASGGTPAKWDVSKVTTFESMFKGAEVFNSDISNWVTSAATSMNSMFSLALKFNQNLGAWDVSKVTNFGNMFNGAKVFNNGESDTIKNWDTRAAVFMQSMFRSSAFNQPITRNGNAWDVGNVTMMTSMFESATAFNQALTWNTDKASSMNRMFRNAAALTNIPNLQIDVLSDGSDMLSFSGLTDDQYGTFVIDAKAKYNAITQANRVAGVKFGASDKAAACNDPNQAVRDLVAAGWVITDKTDRTNGFCLTTVTVTAENLSHVYGNAVPSVGFSISPAELPNSDWIKDITCKAIVVTTSNDAFSSNVVPTSPVTPAAGTAYKTRCTGPLGSGLGLSITYVDGTYSVGKRPITVAAVDQAVFAGQATSDTPTTVDSSDTENVLLTAGSILQGDLVNFTLAYTTPATGGAAIVSNAYTASDVGTLTITVALRSGEESDNYTLNSQTGLLTVTNKTYIISAKSLSKVYGESESFNNQDWTCVEKVATTPVTTTACPAGVAVALSSTGASSSALVGEHDVLVDNVQGISGTIERVKGTLWVTKKTIVLTPVAKQVVYGADEPSYDFTFLSSEFVNGKGENTITGITCDSGYNKETPRGTVLPITCSGGTSDFYDFSYGTANLTVLEDSRVSRDVPQSVMLGQEETEAVVEFNFELAPVNEICYVTFTLFAEGESLEPIEVRVGTGEDAGPVSFDFELDPGNYDYQLNAYGNCSVAETVGQLVITEYVAPAPQPEPEAPAPVVPVPYSGPIVNDFSTRQLPVQKPTPVELNGDRLDMITEVWIGDTKLPFTRDAFGKITITAPALLAGVYDLRMVYEGGGTLIHQAAFTVFGSAAGGESTQGGPASVVGTRTLRYTNFAGDGFRLPQSARVGITRVMTSLDDVNRVVCRGITSARSTSAADQRLAERRASEACNLARQLAPTASIELRTSPAAGVGPKFRAVNLFIVYSLD